MNVKLYQKYYIQCLFYDNKCNDYIDEINKFKDKFKNINFLLTDDIVKKIKINITGTIKNATLEDIVKSLLLLNKDLIIDKYHIKAEYLNKNKCIELREQDIFLIGEKNMIKYLDHTKGKQYGIDCTFKIVPNTFKPYKIMTIYTLNEEENRVILAAILCIKYTDCQSLQKKFSVLNINYNFEPIAIACDFDSAQIKALKNCYFFKKNRIPYFTLWYLLLGHRFLLNTQF